MAELIRLETEKDVTAIRHVHTAAFGRDDEARIVAALREGGYIVTSLVAEDAGLVVGHVLFSRIRIVQGMGELEAVALGPVAVLLEFQRRGIAARLIRAGLQQCAVDGQGVVLVLGEPAYYSRFGFTAAMAASLKTPFPPEYFMALELTPGALAGVAGIIKYPPPWGVA